MKHLDLFSGIGGFALAAEWTWPDTEHVFCEIDPFCQAVLRKHWPQSTIHEDIRQLTAHAERQGQLQPQGSQQEEWRRSRYRDPVDLLTGGFPCQPFSAAGRRRGTEDDRYLWPEMLRVIREFHPRWIIGENVGGFVTWSDGMVLEQVHADLEGEGYEVQSFIIPAVSVNAPHRRDRVWILAHDKHARLQGSSDEGSRHGRQRDRAWSQEGPNWRENWAQVAARLCVVDDGLPSGLARPRGWRNAALKGAGNAIVPQVAHEIMRAISASEQAA